MSTAGGDTPPHGFPVVRQGDTPPHGMPVVAPPLGPWKYCSRCSAQVQTRSPLCPFCGASYVRPSVPGPPQFQQPPPAQPWPRPAPWTDRVNVMGVGIALLGALGMLIAVFLPRVEATTTFGGVAENTLIQSGTGGWWFVGLALAVIGAVYGVARSGGGSGWAIVILGGVAIALAFYNGASDEALMLYPIGEGGEPDGSAEGTMATPSIGIYLAGLGGVLAAWGGLHIATSSPARR